MWNTPLHAPGNGGAFNGRGRVQRRVRRDRYWLWMYASTASLASASPAPDSSR